MNVYEGNVKLTLGLLWTLIQKYQLRIRGRYEIHLDTDTPTQHKQVLSSLYVMCVCVCVCVPSGYKVSTKDVILQWVQALIPALHITNLTTDWADGR